MNDKALVEKTMGRNPLGYKFIQLSEEFMPAFRKLAKDSPCGNAILLYVMQEMKKQDNSFICSYKALQENTGFSKATIARGLTYLEEHNWIERLNVGKALIINLNERVAWKSSYTDRKYAKFSATVIVDLDEQYVVKKEPLIDLSTECFNIASAMEVKQETLE